jgi:hypothetical protein
MVAGRLTLRRILPLWHHGILLALATTRGYISLVFAWARRIVYQCAIDVRPFLFEVNHARRAAAPDR